MNYIQLDYRLSPVISFVLSHPEISVVYDYFCDHGKLGCALLERKLVETAYFIDSSEQSLLKAKKITSFKNLNTVNFYLELAENFPPKINDKSTSLVTMAGVGAYTIVKCLDKWKIHEHRSHYFYIVPEKNPELIQNYFEGNSFQLLNNLIVKDKTRSRNVFIYGPSS